MLLKNPIRLNLVSYITDYNVYENPNPNIQMIVESLSLSRREGDLKWMTNLMKNTIYMDKEIQGTTRLLKA